jgi:hypothetical protein
MVAIGGIADIVRRWREMARSRMTQSGHAEKPHGLRPVMGLSRDPYRQVGKSK